jgi:hypothetical protein
LFEEEPKAARMAKAAPVRGGGGARMGSRAVR